MAYNKKKSRRVNRGKKTVTLFGMRMRVKARGSAKLKIPRDTNTWQIFGPK